MTTVTAPPLTVADIIKLCGGKATKAGEGVMVRCPAHTDNRASLSVRETRDGKILLHCHAGCSPEAVRDKLNVEWSQFFPASTLKTNSREIVATYDYTDANNKLLYQVVRYSPKAFSQRRPDGAGGWIWNLHGVERVPYRLPELIEGIALGRTVFFAEGEKDADSLYGHGLTATTNAGGADKWRSEYDHYFAGADIVLLPDNDEPGQKHAATVKSALDCVAKSVRILELPNLPPKGDVSDWLAEGGDAEQLTALTSGIPAQADPTAASPEKRSPLRTLRELLQRPELLVPPPSIIPGIAYAGRITLFSAREKAGKSTLIGQAIAELSRGGEFLGNRLTKAYTLWYPIDEAPSDAVRRFQQFSANPDTVTFQPDRPSPEQLEQEIVASGASVVVIDTAGELWSGLIRSARDAEQVGPFLRPYIDVIRKTNVALILLYHTSKAGVEYRDSIQIGASVDIILTLRMPGIKSEAEGGEWDTGHDDDGRRVLDGRGRGGVKVRYRLTFDGIRYSMGNEPMSLKGRILAELRYGPASGNSLAAVLHARKEAVLAGLRELTNEGLVASIGEGAKREFAIKSSDLPVPVEKSLSLSREPVSGQTAVTTVNRVSTVQSDAFSSVPDTKREEGSGTDRESAA